MSDALGAVALRPAADPQVTIVVCSLGDPRRLLGCLTAVAESTEGLDTEVVVVLNGMDDNGRSVVARGLRGAQLITSRVNRGFAAASNLGAATGHGEFVLLLNDDTIVERGWLHALLAAMSAHPRARAVGSRLLHLDGTLQEAGQVLWADGSTSCVGRDAPPSAHAFEWARRVDYCSASSLLVRRETWERLGGLDEAYFPAYCEDVDFCLRIAADGGEVWYEPTSRVRHAESTSSSPRFKAFLIHRNRPLLVDRWSDVLARRLAPEPGDPVALMRSVRRAMGDPPQVLVVDDRIPTPALGAGLPRMFDTVQELAAAGYHVSLVPTHSCEGDATALARGGVDVVRDGVDRHLGRPEAACDVAIISRPNNFEQWAPRIRRRFPEAPVIYDAEALFYRRMEAHLPLLTGPDRELEASVAQVMRATERKVLAAADHVVCLSEDEAAIVRTSPTSAPVTVKIPLLQGIEPTTRPFDERADLVFVSSWLSGVDSPNVDGLGWFVGEVLPLVHSVLPWVRLRVTGESPTAPVRHLASSGVRFEGYVADLAALYDRARVVVVPLRFGSGVKNKTIEALQFQVPTVSTGTGAEGIDLLGTEALRVADDPAMFARACCQLLDDERAWTDQRAELAELNRRWDDKGARLPTWSEIVTDVRTNAPGVPRHAGMGTHGR